VRVEPTFTLKIFRNQRSRTKGFGANDTFRKERIALRIESKRETREEIETPKKKEVRPRHMEELPNYWMEELDQRKLRAKRAVLLSGGG